MFINILFDFPVDILDSERSEEATGFIMVFIFFILYTKFLPNWTNMVLYRGHFLIFSIVI